MYCKELILEGLDLSKPVTFDTETLGLYGRTRLIQIRQGAVSYEYDCFYINIEEIKYILKSCHLIAHNSIYDLSCPDFKNWIPSKLDDTMLLARQAWPYLDSFSLKYIGNYFNFGIKGSEGSSDWGNYNLTSEQLEYSANDTLITENIYKAIPKEIFKAPSYILDIENILFCCQYQNKGMKVNKKNARHFIYEAKKKLKQIDLKLPQELNVNSYKQVREFLNVENSSKDFLLELSLTDDRAQLILDKRKNLKQISYLEDVSRFDFAYSVINPVGAISGRFTSKSSDVEDSFNLQQIPRDLKSTFGLSDEDGYYVCADYPALEVWVCAAVVNDKFLVNALSNNKDLHYETASILYNKPVEEVTKIERSVGKGCNFSLLYGAGVNMLRDFIFKISDKNINLSLDEAAAIYKKWHQAFEDISKWHKSYFNLFKNKTNHIIQTPMGRNINVDSPIKAMNYIVQGGGSECTKLALYLLKNKGIIPANTVHDSIALIASNMEEAEYYKKQLEYCMEEAYRRVIKTCKCNTLSLKVSAEISKNYT